MISINRGAVSVVAAACVLAAAGCQRTMVPTPLIVAQTPDPYGQVPEEMRTTSLDMLYITDRRMEPKPGRPVWYGYQRSPELSFGLAEVRFGTDLTWEQLVELTSTEKRTKAIPISIGEVRELERLPSAVRRVTMVDGVAVENPEDVERRKLQAQTFYDLLGSMLARTESGDVYLFVHGYHNNFDDALYPMAQMWHFAGRRGVPIVFSWPAGAPGLLRGYTRDRESGEYAVYHLKNVIRAIAASPDVERLHLIGHSRGTDVLTSAIRELYIAETAAGRKTTESLKLHTIMLAAPDLDAEVVAMRIGAEELHNAADRFTVYVSPNDEAIGIADFLFRSQRRIGQIRYEDFSEVQRERLALFGGAFVSVTAPTTEHGHSYFYNQPQVSSDVLLMLGGDRPPGAEHGRPLKPIAPGWWELDKHYLKGGEPAREAAADEYEARVWWYE